jgi:tRNA pseudouridine38-40 synthase
MQKNICLKIEYIGSNYFGFQLQDKKGKKEITIQEALEKAIGKLFRKKIRITAASRTDRGVHAKAQVVNFKVDTDIPLKNIKGALNAFLPKDIRVKSIKIAPFAFHARFWTKSKIYRYLILNKNEPSVFLKDFSWHIAKPLDVKKMNKTAQKLRGKKDFSLFAKEAKTYKDSTREIKELTVKKRGGFISVDIEANGFLRNMVRNIVTFLVKVGAGKVSLEKALGITKREIPYINKPAPACGLYLIKVKYS